MGDHVRREAAARSLLNLLLQLGKFDLLDLVVRDQERHKLIFARLFFLQDLSGHKSNVWKGVLNDMIDLAKLHP